VQRLIAVAGFVLAGGESSRMGRDKALLELDGVPLLVRTVRLVESVIARPTVIGQAGAYQSLGLHSIADDWPTAGPLGGIATALRASAGLWSLIVACDLPYLTKAWLDYLVGRALASEAADVLLPLNLRGAEPLCAMYHKRCQPAIHRALTRGTRKVTDALLGLQLKTIDPAEWEAFDPDGLLFNNMNSPADYEVAKARLGGTTKQ
jgi:molybdopterin-guanine dinucleotide biosynthesis protein A